MLQQERRIVQGSAIPAPEPLDPAGQKRDFTDFRRQSPQSPVVRLEKILPVEQIPRRISAKPELRGQNKIGPLPDDLLVTPENFAGIPGKIPDRQIHLKNSYFHNELRDNYLCSGDF